MVRNLIRPNNSYKISSTDATLVKMHIKGKREMGRNKERVNE